MQITTFSIEHIDGKPTLEAVETIVKNAKKLQEVKQILSDQIKKLQCKLK